PDIEADLDFSHEGLRPVGSRSFLAVPMVRGGLPIGTIAISRAEVGPFPPDQIELVKVFADQAVIAVENVRLFQELEARNRDLTESLEQQTATSEILRAISSSPTDLRPVLAAIAESAARLCDARDTVIWLPDGEALRAVATVGLLAKALTSRGPTMRLSRGSI